MAGWEGLPQQKGGLATIWGTQGRVVWRVGWELWVEEAQYQAKSNGKISLPVSTPCCAAQNRLMFHLPDQGSMTSL